MDRSAKVFELLLYEWLEKAAAAIRSGCEIPVAPIIEDVFGHFDYQAARNHTGRLAYRSLERSR